MPDVVGTAWVVVRAITEGIAGDIQDGIKKGAAEADAESAGRDLGGDLSKGVGKGVEKDAKKAVSSGVSKVANDPGVKKESEKVGNSISKGIFSDKNQKEMSKQFSKTFKDLQKSVGGAFKFPGGKIDWLFILGPSVAGGAIQVLSASLGTLTAVLGQVVLASAGAGVAVGGLFAALAIGVIPIVLAFKDGMGAADGLKKELDSLTTSFKSIGEATMTTLAPGLTAAVSSLEKFIPLFRDFGASQGAIVGDIARTSAAALTSSTNMAIWKQGLSEIGPAFRDLGRGISGVAGALPTLFTSVMPIAQQFSKALGDMGTKFGDFITKTGTTNLTATFQGWYDKAAQVFRILGDLALGLFRILRIGSETTGQTIFDKFEAFAKHFDAWTKSVKGDNSLRDFFNRSKTVMDSVSKIIGAIAKALFKPIAGAAKSTSITGTLETVRTKWLPPLEEIITKFRESNKLSLGALIDQISKFLDILASNPQLITTVINAFSTNLTVFTTALKLLNTALSSGVGRALFNFFSPLIPLLIIASKLKLANLAKDIVGLGKAFGAFKNVNQKTLGTDIIRNLVTGFKTQMANLSGNAEEETGAVGNSFFSMSNAIHGAIGLATGYMIGHAKNTQAMSLGIIASVANIGTAFAQGGLIGAGIATLTTGIGIIGGLWKKHSDQIKAAAEAQKKLYKDIGEAQKTAFTSAFQKVGSVKLDKRALVGLSAMRDLMDNNTKGAKTFSRAFGVSMGQTAAAMGKGTKSFKAWTVEVRHAEIQKVMAGQAQATAVWGDAAKEAGKKAANMISGLHFTAVTASSGGLHDKIIALGHSLETGAISWDQYVAAAKKLGVPLKDLARGQVAFSKSLNESMLQSDSGAFLQTLPDSLHKAGKAFIDTMEVQKIFNAQQEAMKPAGQKAAEAFEGTKKKLSELAQQYIDTKLAAEQLADQQAGSELGIIGSQEKIFGVKDQAGLGSTVKDQLEATQATVSAQKDFVTAYTNSAADIKKHKGTYADLLTWQAQYRQSLKQSAIEAGTPISPALLEWINKVTTIDPTAVVDLETQLNGEPKNPEELAQEAKDFAGGLKETDQKKFNTWLYTWVSENGALTPAQQQSVNVSNLNRDLSGINGLKAQTNAYHFVSENTKTMSTQQIAEWAKKQGISLKDLNGAKAVTTNAQDSVENGVKKSTPKKTEEAGAHGRALHGLNGTKAGTSTAHTAAENGVRKSTPTMSAETRTLRDRLIGGGGLNGAKAAANAYVNSAENGVPKGIEPMKSDIDGLRQKIKDLDGLKASAEFELHAKVFAEGQAAAIINNDPLLKAKYGLAVGGYVNKPSYRLIGEAGPEIVLPLRDRVRSMELLTKYAPNLIGASSKGASLDRLTLAPARGRAGGRTSGPITGLHIEHATINEPADVDLVAAKLRSSLRSLGV